MVCVPDGLAKERSGRVEGSVAVVAATAADGLQETCGKFPQHLPRLNDQLLQVLPRPQPVSQAAKTIVNKMNQKVLIPHNTIKK